MVLSCTKHGFKVSFMISGIPKGAFRRCGVDSVTNPSLKSPGTHHTNKTQLLIQTHRTPHLLFSHHRFSLHPRDAPAAFLNITHEIQGLYLSSFKPEPKLLRHQGTETKGSETAGHIFQNKASFIYV